MIKIKEVTLRNFFSTGNNPQKVTINEGLATLIIGDNIDYGESESGKIRNGVGKAQPLTAKIRVQNGWKTMGDIKVGDIVQTPEGGSTVVMGKFPQGKREVFEIRTTDGKKTYACAEHLWEVGNGEVIDTREIIARLAEGKTVTLPTSVGEMDKVIPFEIDPYVVGALLAHGAVAELDGKNRIVIDTYDGNVINRILKKNNYSHISGGILINDEDTERLRTIFDTSSGELVLRVDLTKYDSMVRKGILCGVFDSAVDNTKLDDVASVVAYFDNNAIATQVRNLIWSLGGLCVKKSRFNANISGGSGVNTSSYITLDITVNDLASYFTYAKFDFRAFQRNVVNTIASIKTHSYEDVCCIKLSSTRQLYITDDYIPTHNTTMINAISYALYGETITKPRKKAAVINYINGKGLVVTLDFEVDGVCYHITRGQKPDIMSFIRYSEDGTPVELAQGSNANTDKAIVEVIGMSHLLCNYIMLMSTYAKPFMAEEAAKQRAIIEELLGIGELSIKAEAIKEKERLLTNELEKEEVRIKTIAESNARIEKNIVDLLAKSEKWVADNAAEISKIEQQIVSLMAIDIEAELKAHAENAIAVENNRIIDELEREKNRLVKENENIMRLLNTSQSKLDQVSHLGVCHECRQTLGAAEAKEQETKILNDISVNLAKFDESDAMIKAIEGELSTRERKETISTAYSRVDQAHAHGASLKVLEERLLATADATNPYASQIEALSGSDYGIQTPDYSKIEELERIAKHYKYLKKLLTHKDSFLRKVIINRSLPFLNTRLRYYLDILSLPHVVSFDADLTFDIKHMGIESDYSLLSRGEQNRITYALNLAFRDLFENTRKPINVVFVDELLDFGVDSTGAIAGLQILKNMSYAGKSTFLVTHKEELVERVRNIIYVKKENGFTAYQEQVN